MGRAGGRRITPINIGYSSTRRWAKLEAGKILPHHCANLYQRERKITLFGWSLSTCPDSTVTWHPKARRCSNPEDSRSVCLCRRSPSRKLECTHSRRDGDRSAVDDARTKGRLVSLDVYRARRTSSIDVASNASVTACSRVPKTKTGAAW